MPPHIARIGGRAAESSRARHAARTVGHHGNYTGDATLHASHCHVRGPAPTSLGWVGPTFLVSRFPFPDHTAWSRINFVTKKIPAPAKNAAGIFQPLFP